MLGKVFFVLTLASVSRTVTCSDPAVRRDRIFDYDLYESVLDAETCERHLSEMNSLEFYDASFRIPQGLLGGNFVSYGNYFQCLSVSQTIEGDHIEGKHCMIRSANGESATPWSLHPEEVVSEWARVLKRTDDLRSLDLDVNLMSGADISRTSSDDINRLLLFLSVGVCIPKSCTVHQALGQYLNNTLVSLDYEEMYCRLPGDKPWVPADYVAVVVFSLLGLMTIVSTGYDLHHNIISRKDPKTQNQLYSCCSVYTNTRRLFTFSPTPGTLGCLDGIRSLSILWIIVAHAVITKAMAGTVNFTEMMQWYMSFDAAWLKAATLGVDSFFLLSGLLLVYISAQKMTQSGLIRNLHLFYLNRLLRLFPILAAAVLLQASLLHRVSDGPNWHFLGEEVQTCRQYWWAALLHVQNYYNPGTECLPHTWYLSVDIQLYLVSPLVLFWALGGRRSGWAGVAVALLVSLTASTLYIFLVVSVPGTDNHRHYYANTLTRGTPFFVGMFLGYFLHVCRRQKVDLPKWLVAFGWTSALVCSASVCYAFHAVMQPGFDNEMLNSLHLSFSRPLWTVAVAWLIFACHHGYGGPIDWFLSLTIWKFVARISYAMYIVHYPIQFLGIASVLMPSHFNVTRFLVKYINDLSLTVIASILFCIIIDAPFSTLQKTLLGGGPRKPKVKEPKSSAPPPEA